jgi:hypothetical protein
VAEARAGVLPAYVERALAIVAREAPVHFTAMRAELGGLGARVRAVGAPPFRVTLASGPPWVALGDERQAIELGVGEEALEDLVTGRATIEDAVETEGLRVRGSIDDVGRFLDALRAWLHGAFRAPSMPELRRSFLERVPLATGARTVEQQRT